MVEHVSASLETSEHLGRPFGTIGGTGWGHTVDTDRGSGRPWTCRQCSPQAPDTVELIQWRTGDCLSSGIVRRPIQVLASEAIFAACRAAFGVPLAACVVFPARTNSPLRHRGARGAI